jgi:hypothetical protein
MSFLTPLYIAGALAVTLPILFHLIRRTPRGEAPFSSLMFLSPSPPRITRRSRIEHWLLLALRGLALVLLALAFSRPFWRTPAQGNDADASQHRVAIVVDTSASMRRDDLWRQAAARVDAALAACNPQDQIGVYACDEALRPIASFDDLAQVPPNQRRAVVGKRLADLKLGWSATHLGQGLLDALALVNDSRDQTEEAGRAARRIVLVSDMQAGGRVNVLGDAAWPSDVKLELMRVAPKSASNAGLWRLADDAEAAAAPAAAGHRRGDLRIRVANAGDSATEQFKLQWTDASGAAIGAAVDAYVPAGERRVVRVPSPESATGLPRLVLAGDDHDFDNTLYFIPEDRTEIVVGFLGDDAADDPQGLRYYLERAVTADLRRDVRVEDLAPLTDLLEKPEQAPPLVVVASEPPNDVRPVLQKYVAGGGTLLYVLKSVESAPGLAALLGVAELPATEAEVNVYAMLGEIDFHHPLFAAMAGPRFNDFSQIRFWRYRKLDLAGAPQARAVARFENGDPAIVEQRIGAGRLVALTAGWSPDDGQLARSWKFLLMLTALVEDRGAARDFATSYLVNELVPLTDRAALGDDARVTGPGGIDVPLPADATAFVEASRPGVYTLSTTRGPVRFAVNIDPLESDTAPLEPEAFEQLGVKLAGRSDAALDAARLEQLRDVELEGRQRIWQWLVAAALGALIVETWLAGRLSRRADSNYRDSSPGGAAAGTA